MLVAHVLWRLTEAGGVQIVIRRLAAAADPGRVRFVAVNARAPRDAAGDGIEMLNLGLSYPLRRGWRLRLAWGVARAIRRLRPDVVQLHSGTAWFGLVARLLHPRTPFVLEVHDAPGSGRHGHTTDRFEGWMVRRLGVTAVCHSSSVQAAVLDRWRPRPDRVVTFPLGVDTGSFADDDRHAARAAWRSAHHVDSDAFVMVAVGRFARSKRFDLCVGVLRRLVDRGANGVLVLVGDGPTADSVRELVAAEGLSDRVVMTGSLVGPPLTEALAAADVLCSMSEYEGFGLTLVEAMAAGLPVVATSVGGVTDIVVEDKTGFLVRPGDVDAVADRLARLAADPVMVERLGEAARRRAVERFDSSVVAARFTDLYEQLTAGRVG